MDANESNNMLVFFCYATCTPCTLYIIRFGCFFLFHVAVRGLDPSACIALTSTRDAQLTHNSLAGSRSFSIILLLSSLVFFHFDFIIIFRSPEEETKTNDNTTKRQRMRK